jgi:hypothetical protein
MADLGKPIRVIEVEPDEAPVPVEFPDHPNEDEPSPAPVEEPVEVPA